ncbi:hypothetical protein CspHIS471_0308470 [Cutaneotrichosporon sp. HIS471]|nr:hypothetical protein CspHIS471_0308470 [Cutaneotrichosporon sp. HIS471]
MRPTAASISFAHLVAQMDVTNLGTSDARLTEAMTKPSIQYAFALSPEDDTTLLIFLGPEGVAPSGTLKGGWSLGAPILGASARV